MIQLASILILFCAFAARAQTAFSMTDFSFCRPTASASVTTYTNSFTNSASITIRDDNTAGTYPSTLVVSAVTGSIISGTTITITGLSHTYEADTAWLLVSPGGKKILFFSEGAGTGVSGLTLTFSDSASATWFGDPSGTYLPTVNSDDNYFYAPGDFSSAPAPAPPYAHTMSGLNGDSPNGTWNLYIVDTANPDSGTLSGGWYLTLLTQ